MVVVGGGGSGVPLRRASGGVGGSGGTEKAD